MDKISKYIQKINHTITVAGLNHDIWWTYKKKKYRKILLYVQDFYPSIFSTSVHAHFVATIMAAYQLLEDRNKRDIVKCCGIKILQRILIPRILPKQHPLSQ